MEQTQLHTEQIHPPWAVRRRELWTGKGPHPQAAGIRNPKSSLTGDPSMVPLRGHGDRSDLQEEPKPRLRDGDGRASGWTQASQS